MSAGARYSADFILAALPPAANRVLEVGCGDGEVAALLIRNGCSVIAIDSDPLAVAAAHDRGVDARLARWPDFADGGFDAILFTRSLHHVEELPGSVDAAFDRLRPGGRVVVEDFDHEDAPESTLRWFRGLARIVARCGALPPDCAAAGFLETPEPLAGRWRTEHDHDLHAACAIDAALAARAAHLERRTAAYYFRYFGGDSPLLEPILRHELELVEMGLIEPLGRRWVADGRKSRPSSLPM